MTSRILSTEQPTLFSHLRSINASDRQLFWPLLSTGWSVVLPLKDWLIIWDHIVTVGTSFLPCLLAATLASLAPTLLSCGNTWMVGNLLNSTVGINISKLLTLAHSYLERHWRVVEIAVSKHKPSVLSEGGLLISESRQRASTEKDERRALQEVPLNTRQDESLRLAVERALSGSPPEVPRLASSKISQSFNPTDSKPNRTSSSILSDKLPGPMEPLPPALPSTSVLDESPVRDIADLLLSKAIISRKVSRK